MLIMVWQTLVGMTPYAVAARSAQWSHAAVHEQQMGHHHHHDASLHLSADGERSPHAHGDEIPQPVALAAPDLGLAAVPPSVRPMADDTLAPPSIVLDGPLRPPRALTCA